VRYAPAFDGVARGVPSNSWSADVPCRVLTAFRSKEELHLDWTPAALAFRLARGPSCGIGDRGGYDALSCGTMGWNSPGPARWTGHWCDSCGRIFRTSPSSGALAHVGEKVRGVVARPDRYDVIVLEEARRAVGALGSRQLQPYCGSIWAGARALEDGGFCRSRADGGPAALGLRVIGR